MANIKRIKLNNGQIYSIFDEGALRLDPTTQKLITGNKVVDKVVLDGDLFITEIDDEPVEKVISNVLIQDPVTGQIKKRSVDCLLKDIGGVSCSMDETTWTLALKQGK